MGYPYVRLSSMVYPMQYQFLCEEAARLGLAPDRLVADLVVALHSSMVKGADQHLQYGVTYEIQFGPTANVALATTAAQNVQLARASSEEMLERERLKTERVKQLAELEAQRITAKLEIARAALERERLRSDVRKKRTNADLRKADKQINVVTQRAEVELAKIDESAKKREQQLAIEREKLEAKAKAEAEKNAKDLAREQRIRESQELEKARIAARDADRAARLERARLDAETRREVAQVKASNEDKRAEVEQTKAEVKLERARLNAEVEAAKIADRKDRRAQPKPARRDDVPTDFQRGDKTATTVSGYFGVYPYYGRWAAYVKRDGKTHRVGVYDDPLEAAVAYDAAHREATHKVRPPHINFPIGRDTPEEREEKRRLNIEDYNVEPYETPREFYRCLFECRTPTWGDLSDDLIAFKQIRAQCLKDDLSLAEKYGIPYHPQENPNDPVLEIEELRAAVTQTLPATAFPKDPSDPAGIRRLPTPDPQELDKMLAQARASIRTYEYETPVMPPRPPRPPRRIAGVYDDDIADDNVGDMSEVSEADMAEADLAAGDAPPDNVIDFAEAQAEAAQQPEDDGIVADAAPAPDLDALGKLMGGGVPSVSLDNTTQVDDRDRDEDNAVRES